MKKITAIALVLVLAIAGCKTKQPSTASTDMKHPKVADGSSTTTTTTTTTTVETKAPHTKAPKPSKASDGPDYSGPVPPASAATYGRTAHAIIYRTNRDYSQYVPVTLTDDGSAIASYPAPSDVYYKGTIAKPTQLANGYLLDNRGVTPHSAFIRITYEEYAAMKELPSLTDMYKLIIDKAPFKDMYDLGERNVYGDNAGMLNSIVKSGKLNQYKKLM